MVLKKNIIKGISALCVILACFSCKKDNQLIDPTGESDKTIQNTSGTLGYNEEFEVWQVRHHIPGTHDSVDYYLITEMPDKKFTFEEGKQVSVSGFCYRIPRLILADKGIFYTAGVECYYIKVTDIK